MCGIAGYIGPNNFKQNQVRSFLENMKSRGPNSQNFFQNLDIFGNNVLLLHSRLSIFDLSQSGNQPFFIKNYIIIYNGEIYNFKELRQILVKRGVKLKSNTDTEVLLHFFIIYGEECLDFFEGMWSFVIFDTQKKNFFISRDRFGEKPLYYYQDSTGFYFGSEINYIKNFLDTKLKINEIQLEKYLRLGYKSLNTNNETFYKNLKIFPKSTFVHQKDLSKLIFRNYWKLKYKPNKNINNNEIIAESKRLLIDSVGLRLRSEVPIGLCLSGGVDSVGIAAVAKNIFNKNLQSYSIIDPDVRYNEIQNITLVEKNLNLKNYKIYLKKNNSLLQLKKLIEYKSHPVCTLSYFSHFLMLKKMKKHSIKVCLLGTAADEIFTGYYDHFLLHLSTFKNKITFKANKDYFLKYIRPYIRNKLLLDPDKYNKNPDDRRHIYDESSILSRLIKKKTKFDFHEINYSSDLLRKRMMNELFHETTPAILNEDDTNSMYNSIENRSPYLDRRLVEFLYTVPSNFLIQEGYSKYILRKSLEGIVDSKVLFDRKKIGFNSSVDSLFDFTSKNNQDFLYKNDSLIYKYIDKNKIKEIIKIKNKPNYISKFVFNIINAKIFLDLNS
jgi:asparagine synthase (glutamine-hydrolysing)